MTSQKDIHYNYEMCKACGGYCCKHYAGTYIPSDFKEAITPDFIASLLNSGRFAVDWWEGDAKEGGNLSQTYFIRPRHKNEGAVKGSWGGECVNWSKEKGCSLTEEERPYQCRMLIPDNVNGEMNCHTKKEDKADKQNGAIAWYELQAIIKEAIEIYTNQVTI